MELKIARYKKIYKIFVVLMLIALIDSVIIPGLFKSIGKEDLGNIGLLPVGFILVFGKTGGLIALWFTSLWFVWGLVAAIYNRMANKLENKLKSGLQTSNTKLK